MSVLRWAVATFGPVAESKHERVCRILEEALELAQAEGVPEDTARKILARAYSRPVGEPRAEYQGLCLTLQAYAELVEDPIRDAVMREFVRVISRSREEWRARHDAKAADGCANLSD
jgi:hypothetical protein